MGMGFGEASQFDPVEKPVCIEHIIIDADHSPRLE
jgi:hypothetical protein